MNYKQSVLYAALILPVSCLSNNITITSQKNLKPKIDVVNEESEHTITITFKNNQLSILNEHIETQTVLHTNTTITYQAESAQSENLTSYVGETSNGPKLTELLIFILPIARIMLDLIEKK